MTPGHMQDGKPLCDRHSVFCGGGGHKMDISPWGNFDNSAATSDPSTSSSLRGTHNPFFFFLLLLFAMIFLVILLRSCCRICDSFGHLCPQKSPTSGRMATTTTSGGHSRPRFAPFTQAGNTGSPPPSPAVHISSSGSRRGHPHMFQRHSLPNYVSVGSLSSFRPISYLPSISEFDPVQDAPMWPSPQHQHQQTLPPQPMPYGTFERRTTPLPPVSTNYQDRMGSHHHGDTNNAMANPPQPPAYTNPAPPPPSYAEAVLGSA